MIDPSVLLALETKNEIRIAVKLSASEEPMRHKDISEILQIDGKRCGEAIKSLVEKKVIVKTIMFGVTVYSVSAGVQNAVSSGQNAVSSGQNAVSRSPVNMLTSVNTTNETNKEDSEISFGAQASVSPGVAGQHAIEAELIPPASAVPADSFRSAGGAKIHSAGGAAKTAAMPPKIDADAFGRQTGQILPDCQTAAQPPFNKKLADNINLIESESNKLMEKEISEISQANFPTSPDKTASRQKYRTKKIRAEQQKTLFQFLGDPKKRDGSVFLTDTATDSLYFMLAYMEGKTAPDPDFVPEYGDDMLPTNRQKMLPMLEVFKKYLRLVLNEAMKYSKPGEIIYDFVAHRAAYLFTTQNMSELPYTWHDPRSLAKVANDAKGPKTTIGGGIACELQKAFEYLHFGWDDQVLRNEVTYTAELDIVSYRREVLGEADAKPRNDLFLSHMRTKGLFAKPAMPNPPPKAVAVNRCPVMAKIAEKTGLQFDLWFGDDIFCEIDEKKKELVFEVPGASRINSINRQCGSVLDEAMRELGFVNKNGTLWKRRMRPKQLPLGQEPHAAERTLSKEERILKHKEEARQRMNEDKAAEATWQANRTE